MDAQWESGSAGLRKRCVCVPLEAVRFRLSAATSADSATFGHVDEVELAPHSRPGCSRELNLTFHAARSLLSVPYRFARFPAIRILPKSTQPYLIQLGEYVIFRLQLDAPYCLVRHQIRLKSAIYALQFRLESAIWHLQRCDHGRGIYRYQQICCASRSCNCCTEQSWKTPTFGFNTR